MAISKAQQEAVARYNAKNYDRIEVKVPKGEKDLYTAHAKSQGESLNAFANRAMQKTMERDQEGSQSLTGDELDAPDKLPLDD